MSIDLKKVGDNYLEIAKRMRRSESHRNEVQAENEHAEKKHRIDQGSLLLSRAQNRSQDFYEGIRRRRIEDIVNSEETGSR